MTEEQLEGLISRRSADVLRLQAYSDDKAITAGESLRWKSEARRAAVDVAELISMRPPSTAKSQRAASS